MSTNTIYDRQPGESERAFAAFRCWLVMGDKRSVRAVAQKLHKSSTIIGRWSSRWRWQERVRAWDAEQDAIFKEAGETALKEHAAEIARVTVAVKRKQVELVPKLFDQAERMLARPLERVVKRECVKITPDMVGQAIQTVVIHNPARWAKADAPRMIESGLKLLALDLDLPKEKAGPSGKGGAAVISTGAVIAIGVTEEEMPRPKRTQSAAPSGDGEHNGNASP